MSPNKVKLPSTSNKNIEYNARFRSFSTSAEILSSSMSWSLSDDRSVAVVVLEGISDAVPGVGLSSKLLKISAVNWIWSNVSWSSIHPISRIVSYYSCTCYMRTLENARLGVLALHSICKRIHPWFLVFCRLGCEYVSDGELTFYAIH